MRTGLLIDIHTEHLAALAQQLQLGQIEMRVATNLDDVVRILVQERIEFVFLGYGYDSEHKLEILAHIFTVDPVPQIHIMGQAGDPVAFVTGILV